MSKYKLTCRMIVPVSLLLNCFFAMPASPQTGPASVPAAFGVANHETILVVQATGAQIYECKADANGATSWTFREPVATLVRGGETVGRHYAGPTWELSDGEAVQAKQSATAPGATSNDVALLKLDVVNHRGSGILQSAKFVLRLNTSGGVLKGECPKAGELRAAAYSADYTFLK